MSQPEISLPVRIQLMGQWISIKYVDEISGEAAGTHGIFDGDNQQIIIRNQSNLDEMYKTLIHELGHAMFLYSGMGEVVGYKKEEGICRLLENFAPIFKLTSSPRFCRLRHGEGQD